MSETLHLLVTPLCDRDCPHCCNKQYDLSKVPVVTEEELSSVTKVYLTGGEPFQYSQPNAIAGYLKHKYLNIQSIGAYTNAYEFYRYVISNGELYQLDLLTISIKRKYDELAFEKIVEWDRRTSRICCGIDSVWVYVFPGYEDVKVPEYMTKINRTWQEKFEPAPNSFFRRL